MACDDVMHHDRQNQFTSQSLLYHQKRKHFHLKMMFSPLTVGSLVLLSASVGAFAPQSQQGATQTKLYSGVERNANFDKLAGGYLFPEIGRRRNAYLEEHPEMADRVISLGIGDTTQPIPPHILSGLVEGAKTLGTNEGYSGYGPDQGGKQLREKIAKVLYNDIIDPADVFVSDGAKCDIMRIQQMFGSKVVSAVQDPSYPVYVDTSVMMGQTGEQDTATMQYESIVYMPCTPENGFFPDYAKLPRADVVYICSPK
jgi:LL-diaminopimelate aminotransferase